MNLHLTESTSVASIAPRCRYGFGWDRSARRLEVESGCVLVLCPGTEAAGEETTRPSRPAHRRRDSHWDRRVRRDVASIAVGPCHPSDRVMALAHASKQGVDARALSTCRP